MSWVALLLGHDHFRVPDASRARAIPQVLQVPMVPLVFTSGQDSVEHQVHKSSSLKTSPQISRLPGSAGAPHPFFTWFFIPEPFPRDKHGSTRLTLASLLPTQSASARLCPFSNFLAQRNSFTSSAGWTPGQMMQELIKHHSDRVCHT